MLKGFKDFIMRGNVVDLAVGIVIGAAFSTVITAFTAAFLKPLIQVLSGGEGVNAGAFIIRDVAFDWAGFINAVITFVITAAALYFLVVYPLNKLAERRARGEEPPTSAPSEDIVLLTEIRDLLAAGRAGTGAASDVNVHDQRQQEPPRYS